MEQRQVGLGEVLDDYCTRERRVTNHAVVAIVGNEIKLTRCTTCDTEHPYKEARVPPRRQTRLVAGLSSTRPNGKSPALQGAGKIEPEAQPVQDAAPAAPDGLTAAAAAAPASEPAEAAEPARTRVDSVRRPLIRATLSRPEGAPPPARQAPVFTVRESSGRDGNVDRRQGRKRWNGSRSGAEPNGNRIEGYQGQSTKSGQGKSSSGRSRSAGRGNNGQSGNRARGRSR